MPRDAVRPGHPRAPGPGTVRRLGAHQGQGFGLNRLELYLRLGLSEGAIFPRVPGIEATGVVEQCPGGEFRAGQQVAALMGGMGRVFDGGYADYTCVPATQVIPFRSGLDWATLGAVTTRNPGMAEAVTKAGADHVLIDDGDVARQVREILPGGAAAGAGSASMTTTVVDGGSRSWTRRRSTTR
jgi:NADPH:quinone reductase-like Zn-dependent oxidoreductase